LNDFANCPLPETQCAAVAERRDGQRIRSTLPVNVCVVANEALTFSYPGAYFNRPRTVGAQLEKRF
jgi:hypothetical protein